MSCLPAFYIIHIFIFSFEELLFTCLLHTCALVPTSIVHQSTKCGCIRTWHMQVIHVFNDNYKFYCLKVFVVYKPEYRLVSAQLVNGGGLKVLEGRVAVLES